MTEKRVKGEDVLGEEYYLYEITSSSYTPSLNASITLTVTVKTVYGAIAASKSITLYRNGSSMGAETTNSNGVATWTYSCTSAGMQKFSIGENSIGVFVDNKATTGHTHTTTDITNLSIPTKTSDLTNDGDGTNVFVKNNDSRLSDSRTPTSHTHGNLQNDGKIKINGTAQASKNVVTDSSGNITTEAKPTIPTKTSDLSNDSGYITSSSLPTKTSDLTNDGSSSSDSLVYVETSATSGLIKNNGTIDTNSYSTTSHGHNQITSDGKITSTAVTIASGDNIVITDASDSSKIKRVANLLADHIKDSTAHTNIGSSANATQATINGNVGTALSNKIGKSQTTGLVKNDGTIDTSTYSTFDGNYNSLSNKPSIPASSSDLSDGTSLVKTSNTAGLLKNDGTIDTNSYALYSHNHTISDITNFPDTITIDDVLEYISENATLTIPTSGTDAGYLILTIN